MTTHTIPLNAAEIDTVLLRSYAYPPLNESTSQFLRGDGTFADLPTDVSAHESTHRSGSTDALDIKNLDGYTGQSTSYLGGDATFHSLPTTVSLHESTHRSGGTDALDVKNLAGYTGSSLVYLGGDAAFHTLPDVSGISASIRQQELTRLI